MGSPKKTPATDAFIDSGVLDLRGIAEENERAEIDALNAELLRQKKNLREIAERVRIPESYLEIALGLPKKPRPLYINGMQILGFQDERDAARKRAHKEAVRRSREQIASAQTIEEARALAVNAPDLDTRDMAIRKIYELF